jgi:hypothetical protein
MAKEDISPEERLFNAIETNEGQPAKGESPKKNTLDFKELFLKLKKKTFSFGIKKGEGDKKRFFDIFGSLKIANRILAAGSGVLAVFLITDMIMLKQNPDRIFAETAGMEAAPFQKKPITLLKELSFYEEAAARRDIFNPPAKGYAKSALDTSPRISELTKNLILVGIYWGAHPEAMIEDAEAKKTYFLKRGDMVNGLRIRSILKDRIILEYQGEQMEFM